ncbi:MAG: dienelactone hydrolase family protein [Oligoflexia bacterium]|nr:dienelactone hydrolase family protein [Oligoflexia bacterium]
MVFSDRHEAGKRLAERLRALHLENPVVLGLPRGGIPVAYEVALELNAPLDLVVVRKIGHPLQPEYGIGAVTEDDFYWIDPRAVQGSDIDAEMLEKLLVREAKEVKRRVQAYRKGQAALPLAGRTAILVDDGLATGVSARAAAHLMRGRGATRVLLAVPVASKQSAESLVEDNSVDDLVCLSMPEEFYAVGQWYEDFTQVTDEQVLRLLEHARNRGVETEVEIAAGPDRLLLRGLLSLPPAGGLPTRGVVVFAHGSGSSRLSPRNRKVAAALNRAGLATLLFDLLTEDESDDRRKVFDIPLLAGRLIAASDFIRRNHNFASLPLGYFGASTGVAAALWAAADSPGVAAIVGRGGRPDLSLSRAKEIRAPVLLIVGGNDSPVIELNQAALRQLPHADLVIVPRATHLFEEPGALEQVSEHAIRWFTRHFELAKERLAKAA